MDSIRIVVAGMLLFLALGCQSGSGPDEAPPLQDFSSVYVPAATRPTVWDAYLCADTWLRNTRSPDSAGLVYFRTFLDSAGTDKEYWYLPGDRGDRSCRPMPDIREMDGGFLIQVEHPAIGSIRIYYR